MSFMHRALWLLLWLRVRGWFRRLLRNAGTVRGAVLLVVGVLFFGCIFLNPLVIYFLATPEEQTQHLAGMRRFGPLGLFAYCVVTLLFSTGERAITFTPAEIDFLFPGPFSRRQLLGYKIAVTFLTSLLTALFFSVYLLSHGAWFVAAYAGALLACFFLMLFGMAVGLVANVLGARAHTRARQLVLLVLLALLLLAALHAGGDLLAASPDEILRRVEQTPALRVVLEPLRWFIETMTARDLWPDFALYLALSLGVDLGLVVLVFVLDVQYLEASAAASAKIYAQLQRVRSGGVFAAMRGSRGTAGFSLPGLPWWGGIGPMAWRQLVTAVRSLRGLLLFLGIFAAALLVPLAFGSRGDRPESRLLGQAIAYGLLGVSLVTLPAMITFDFRGDVDRLDVLKSLPVAAWRLVVGQLAVPVLLLTLIQVGLLALIQLVWGGVEAVLGPVLVVGVPFNFLSFEVDNLMFLWFPTRQIPSSPADFQMMGRQLLVLLAKLLVLGVAGGLAGLAGVVLYLLAGESLLLGVSAGWLLLAVFAAALVPLLALAFGNFDVARDTPP
jgi:hypothetical protein